MSLSMNKLLPLLLIVSALGIAAWALLTLASSSLAIADEDQDTISEESDDELDVSPKSRRRPVLEKVVVPELPTPTPEPPTPPGSNTQTRDATGSAPQPPQTFSRSNFQPRVQTQVQQYTETISERNQRLKDRTEDCVEAAKDAGLWNDAWDNDPLVLMFVENSGRIPVWSGSSVSPESVPPTSNLRVWLHQVRTDEYQWLSRQDGQNGAWSHHYRVHPTHLSGC